MALAAMGTAEFAVFTAFFLYSALMVAIIGRTFGMMAFYLRVARGRHLSPGFWLAPWRYFLAFMTLVTAIPWFVAAEREAA